MDQAAWRTFLNDVTEAGGVEGGAGTDVARKVVILARECGLNLELSQVCVCVCACECVCVCVRLRRAIWRTCAFTASWRRMSSMATAVWAWQHDIIFILMASDETVNKAHQSSFGPVWPVGHNPASIPLLLRVMIIWSSLTLWSNWSFRLNGQI